MGLKNYTAHHRAPHPPVGEVFVPLQPPLGDEHLGALVARNAAPAGQQLPVHAVRLRHVFAEARGARARHGASGARHGRRGVSVAQCVSVGRDALSTRQGIATARGITVEEVG
jgi:hypothetical protein